MPNTTPSRWKLFLAFGLVYLFWGSTYLGIDIAVQSIPPALMCAIRFTIAGWIMLAVCAITGRKVLYSPRQLALTSMVGLLLLMGGNLTLSYAELSVSSGLAALIIAITPLWFLILDSWLLGHHQIAARAKAGLALGIVGLFVLFYPELTAKTALASHWRRRLGHPVTTIDPDIDIAAMTDDADAEPPSEAPARADRILMALPERYRRILQLRFLEACSIKEAAQAMQISVSNAKVLQHRALRMAASLDVEPEL